MDERRLPENGLGRRDYDRNMEAFCLHCDLRKEVQTKVSWKLFVLILGGVMTGIGALVSIGAPIASEGLQKMVDTSKETLTAVHSVSERITRIETRQDIIMDDVKELKNKEK